jgi:hypothetical protein
MRKLKGCYDFTTKAYKLENIVYKSCVGNFTKNIVYFLEAFSQYEKGMLPYNGSLGEQPAKIIEIFNIIDKIRRRHLKE